MTEKIVILSPAFLIKTGNYCHSDLHIHSVAVVQARVIREIFDQLQLEVQLNRDELHVFHIARSKIPTSFSSNVLLHRMSRIFMISFMVRQ